MIRMTRRAFARGLAGLSATATGLILLDGCGLLGRAAPQQTRVARIGYLVNISRFEDDTENRAVFRQSLHEFGWNEGQNLTIEWRYAEGQAQRVPEFAAELVRLPVDVLVVPNAVVAAAAMQATSTIPIVAGLGDDPVARGLFTSQAHPGGNVTGLSGIPELSAKQLQLLKEVAPGLSRVGVLWDPANPSLRQSFAVVSSAAQAMGIQVVPMPVHAPEDFDDAFAAGAAGGINGLVELAAQLATFHRAEVVGLAMRYRLPDVYHNRLFVQDGGLMSYGIGSDAIIRRLPYFVDRILRGAQPADVPVEQPTTFELAVNQTAAQALGLTIPPDVAAQVTQWVV
jgi:putative ABC transport system substrate-binding protein